MPCSGRNTVIGSLFKGAEGDMDDRLRERILKKISEEPFARKMGLRLIQVDEGYALVEMTVDDSLLNLFGTVHGGAIFSLIDGAFEAASNSHGTVAVAVNLNVTYTAPAKPGSILRAEAKEIHLGGRTATYDIRVTDLEGTLIAVCHALVYRKNIPL